jgi:peroxin-5
MGLMHQLRAGEVVVDGDAFVPASEARSSQADVKGKGRAIEPSASTTARFLDDSGPLGLEEENAAITESLRVLSQSQREPQAELSASAQQTHEGESESELDRYLREDNQAYMDYWNSTGMRDREREAQVDAQEQEWGHLQRDWDRFEATATGVRQVPHYAFQPHNPYVLGNSSRTHMMHSGGRQALHEVWECTCLSKINQPY